MFISSPLLSLFPALRTHKGANGAGQAQWTFCHPGTHQNRATHCVENKKTRIVCLKPRQVCVCVCVFEPVARGVDCESCQIPWELSVGFHFLAKWGGKKIKRIDRALVVVVA